MTDARDRLTPSDLVEKQETNPLQYEASSELSSGSPTSTTKRKNDNSKDTLSSSIFTADAGVSQDKLQQAQLIFDALPADMQKALRVAHVIMELTTGWKAGQSEGSSIRVPYGSSLGTVYTDSGMFDQALVHELYEMAGQVSLTTLKGSWNDADSVAIADNDTTKIINGEGAKPGNLNDMLSDYNFNNGFSDNRAVKGDGDLMSNAFVADFFATHPSLYQDSWGGSPLLATIQDAPDLVDNIAKAQGLSSANGNSSPLFIND